MHFLIVWLFFLSPGLTSFHGVFVVGSWTADYQTGYGNGNLFLHSLEPASLEHRITSHAP